MRSEFNYIKFKKKSMNIINDSEIMAYDKGKKVLKNSGYRNIDFWGISPGFNAYNKCTSVFYMDHNIFEI